MSKMIRNAPRNQPEKLQRAKDPFATVFIFYEMYVAEAWHMQSSNRANKVESVFSKDRFKRNFDRKIKDPDSNRRLRISETCCTSHAVYQSILNPSTAIGQIILSQIFDRHSLQAHISNPESKSAALGIILNRVKYFPTWLLNPKFTAANLNKIWAYWCVVDDSETLGARYSANSRQNTGYRNYRSGRFQPYRVPPSTPKYDQKLNLLQYRKK